MRTIVEQNLPQQVLLDIGTYMQTAAHIELAVWQITMYAAGIDHYSTDEYREFVAVKISTDGLLKRLRQSADNCPEPLAGRISALAEQIEQGKEIRNLAAHGAFFWEDQEGTLGAAHYFSRGPRKAREFFEVTQSVSRHEVESAIESANQLLHNAIALRRDIIAWRYPDGMPELSVPPG